jgi:undecaprenyl diphosphate synthase
MEITESIKHIAIIMDGNGRWAKERELPRSDGHSAGAQRVLDLMESIRKYNISYLTLYAFSTENWKRSKEEVSFLMDLLAQFLDENQQKLKDNKIRLLVTGRMEELPDFCVERLNKVIRYTAEDYDHTLILALNYGGRQEITDAVRKIAAGVANGEIQAGSITEQTVADHLYLPGIPDPDLMIRTSGEERISNFLLWQLSYAEFYFTDIYWPDFDDAQLEKAINTYYKRNRRFGGRP